MKFRSGICIVCCRHVYRESELVPFQIVAHGQVKVIDLKGSDPWAGVRCICKPCLEVLGEGGRGMKDAAQPIPGRMPG